MSKETFAERLGRLVRDAGLGEAALADVLGVSENQARRILAGTTQSLKLDAALRLCRKLGISPWELAGEADPQPSRVTVSAVSLDAARARRAEQRAQATADRESRLVPGVSPMVESYAPVSSDHARLKGLTARVDRHEATLRELVALPEEMALLTDLLEQLAQLVPGSEAVLAELKSAREST